MADGSGISRSTLESQPSTVTTPTTAINQCQNNFDSMLAPPTTVSPTNNFAVGYADSIVVPTHQKRLNNCHSVLITNQLTDNSDNKISSGGCDVDEPVSTVSASSGDGEQSVVAMNTISLQHQQSRQDSIESNTSDGSTCPPSAASTASSSSAAGSSTSDQSSSSSSSSSVFGTGSTGSKFGGVFGGGGGGCSSSSSASSGGSCSAFSLYMSPCKMVLPPLGGPKFKLLQEGDLQMCRLNHTRTVISKILSSKFLRRWETHHLFLTHTDMTSKTPCGFMEEPLSYSNIEDIYVVTRWDTGQKFCIRIVIPDGSILMQVNNAYLRDQWLHSIQWRRSVYKYKKLLRNTRRPEVLIKELKNMVELSVTTPLQDECIHQIPLEVVSELLAKVYLKEIDWMPKSSYEDIIIALAPLVENNHPSPEICDFFSTHCKDNPRSSLVIELFTPIVHRILKHNVDFGKYPRMRVFVQDYILALNSQNDGVAIIRNFIQSMHGPSSSCPHPRVLPNLVSICLAAIYAIFEDRRNLNSEEINNAKRNEVDWEENLMCFVSAFHTLSQFHDWRPGLAQLLQPIPFPDDALAHNRFSDNFKAVIYNIGMDSRCDVHLMVLGIREGKEGWFHMYCPGNIANDDDDGELWANILKTLVGCCCRRKRFLASLNKMLGPCMLLALRDSNTCQEVLCAMLELDVVDNNDQKLQIVTTLQSTNTGKRHYSALCERQMHLRELQQKGGPKKLTLPSRSTDADVAKLLSCGSFGNLECLSLAFTQVSSSCAEQLIKLPSLRYLNLWSTQFGDAGLQLISEHLHKLQVLNLCETPVTDKGLVSLASMKNLRKLNLNSTSLSAHTFEGLKQKLPALQECDVRYTDAW